MLVLLTVAVPYLAFLTLLAGVSYRVLLWAKSPVSFRIPTTCTQQPTLQWINRPWLADHPACRLIVDALSFRTLQRDQQTDLTGTRLLWLAAFTFHWSLLAILVRHLRLFLDPVPALVAHLIALDSFFQIGTPALYATDVVILAALLALTARRLLNPRLRYLSLPTDYLSLALLLAVAGSGILLRYAFRTDLAAIKDYALSLATLSPHPPVTAGIWFYTHLLLVSLLIAWLPFSKLIHMAGIWLSPTLNLKNNSRAKRHVNPWNYPVRVHTYEEWEDEFRGKMKAAGIATEKD
jgi:nitrate reductase gamma subunit